MEPEIHPRSTPDEEAAILEALTRVDVAVERRSAWWRAGVEENVDVDLERAVR